MPAQKPVKKPAQQATIVGVIRTAAELRLASRMSSPPDLLELRLDSLHRESGLEKGIGRLSVPLIMTARHPSEGGSDNLPNNVRRDLLLRFLPSARYVDVELRSITALRVVLEKAQGLGVSTIISFHDLESTPSVGSLRAKMTRAAQLRPELFKVATRVDSVLDLIRLTQFVAARPRRLPIAAMGIGKLGAISRLIVAQSGSALVYCSLGTDRIEGQVSVDRFRALFRELTDQTSR